MKAEEWNEILANTKTLLATLSEPNDRMGYAANLYEYFINMNGVLSYAMKRFDVSDLKDYVDDGQLKNMHDFYKSQLVKYIEDDSWILGELSRIGYDKNFTDNLIEGNKKLSEKINAQTPSDADGCINESRENLRIMVNGTGDWCRFLSSTRLASKLGEETYKRFYEFVTSFAMELIEFDSNHNKNYDSRYVVQDSAQIAPETKNKKDDDQHMYG